MTVPGRIQTRTLSGITPCSFPWRARTVSCCGRESGSVAARSRATSVSACGTACVDQPAALRNLSADGSRHGRNEGVYRRGESGGELRAVSSPFLQRAWYLNQIEVPGDTVVIRSEFFNVDRTVHMDGRGHPREVRARTKAIPSDGGGWCTRWSTQRSLPASARELAGPVVRASARQHTSLPSRPSEASPVERYQLSQDGTRLLINFVLEGHPDYLAEPLDHRHGVGFRADASALGFGVRPEQAQRFLFR